MQDQVIPDGRWSFDDSVANVFDDMLRRSIPQYDVMRSTVTNIALRYANVSGAIVDLGCSRGVQLEALAQRIEHSEQRFVGIDVSAPMLDAAHELLDSDERVSLRYCDLRSDYPNERASVVLSILTLQFTPIEYRTRIMRRIFDSLNVGGALILVEKVLGPSAHLDDMMTSLYYSLKSSNGYSAEQIERKRLSLEGVLVPVTAHWNEELLRMAGFAEIDCVWRWLNFAGWVAIKSRP